jgi:hypothetical protein
MTDRPRAQGPASRPRPAGPAPRPVAGPKDAPPAEPGRAAPPVGRPKGPVGRGLKTSADDPAPPPPRSDARPTGELSPFQKYGGGTTAAAASSSETVTVVGMVIALVMALGAAMAVVAIILLMVSAGTGMITVPGVTPEKRGTVDTDVAIAGPRAQPKPTAPRGGKAPEAAPEEAGPQPAKEISGTIVFDLKPGELFHTVEAKCPSTPNVRRREAIRGSRVSIVLPDNEDCKLTFQGSLPAYAYLRGGQTKTCTFNPTNCR